MEKSQKRRVVKHLRDDIKEHLEAIRDDKKLIKSLKSRRGKK